ncbi:hypothetical protein ACVCAH_03880 [Micromonospora sp. LZ34]
MSGRKPGRLFGVALALAALAAVAGGLIPVDSNFALMDYDWAASVANVVVR